MFTPNLPLVIVALACTACCACSGTNADGATTTTSGGGGQGTCGDGTSSCGAACCAVGVQQCVDGACCDLDRVCESATSATCCPSGQSCNADGSCADECTPDCEGKVCGDDGCGHSCGSCAGTQSCDESGACVASVTFIRGVYIQTGSYWDGSAVILTSAALDAMVQAGITDVYAQVHFASSGDDGYAASLRPIVQFFAGTGIRVHAWSCPGGYDPTDDGPGSINQRVIDAVADIYANDYGMDGVCLDEFYFPGTAGNYDHATDYVTAFHQQVFDIVRGHGGIATVCTTPEYGVVASVYGVDYAALGLLSDYITPMAYVGDFADGDPAYVGEVVAGIQAETSTPVFPVLETYVSDQDFTLKSVATLNTEVESGTSAGADGYALFRFGMLTGYPTAGPDR